MKKSTPWAEDIEKAIAKAREDASEEATASINKTQHAIWELASQIMELCDQISPTKERTISPPAPKRKATVASQEQMDETLTILRNVRPPDEPLTPKQIAGAWSKGYGGKISAAAALRALVKSGEAVEVKRGKFRAVVMSEGDGQVQTTEA